MLRIKKDQSGKEQRDMIIEEEIVNVQNITLRDIEEEKRTVDQEIVELQKRLQILLLKISDIKALFKGDKKT